MGGGSYAQTEEKPNDERHDPGGLQREARAGRSDTGRIFRPVRRESGQPFSQCALYSRGGALSRFRHCEGAVEGDRGRLRAECLPLFVQMRVAMPVGFALLLAAVIAGRARLSGAAILAEVTGFPACIFFGLGVLGMALMTVFAFRLDSGDPRSELAGAGRQWACTAVLFHWPVPGVMCARAKAPRHRPRLEATEESTMPITVHIYYRGEHGAARRFAQEMLASSTAAAVLFAPSYVLLSYRNAK